MATNTDDIESRLYYLTLFDFFSEVKSTSISQQQFCIADKQLSDRNCMEACRRALYGHLNALSFHIIVISYMYL